LTTELDEVETMASTRLTALPADTVEELTIDSALCSAIDAVSNTLDTVATDKTQETVRANANVTADALAIVAILPAALLDASAEADAMPTAFPMLRATVRAEAQIGARSRDTPLAAPTDEVQAIETTAVLAKPCAMVMTEAPIRARSRDTLLAAPVDEVQLIDAVVPTLFTGKSAIGDAAILPAPIIRIPL
jgi:hypothetical protein